MNVNEPVADLTNDAFLQDLRKQMLRFATVQLSDPHLADDVVQEARMLYAKNIVMNRQGCCCRKTRKWKIFPTHFDPMATGNPTRALQRG
jgi:hypothetical protein